MNGVDPIVPRVCRLCGKELEPEDLTGLEEDDLCADCWWDDQTGPDWIVGH